MSLPITMYMYKGHFLRHKLYMTTLHMLEGGIPQFWLNNYIQDKKYKRTRPTITPISTLHLIEPFLCFFVAIAAATIAFFGELAAKKTII